jgi:hypothetical protein
MRASAHYADVLVVVGQMAHDQGVPVLRPQISCELLARVEEYAKVRGMSAQEAASELIERGLDHFDARRSGGVVVAARRTAAERSEAAKRAALVRWSNRMNPESWEHSEVGRLFSPLQGMQTGEIVVQAVTYVGRDGDAFVVELSLTRQGKPPMDGTIRVSAESVQILSQSGALDVAARILEDLSGHNLSSGFSFALVSVTGSNELLMLQPLRRRAPMPTRIG